MALKRARARTTAGIVAAFALLLFYAAWQVGRNAITGRPEPLASPVAASSPHAEAPPPVEALPAARNSARIARDIDARTARIDAKTDLLVKSELGAAPPPPLESKAIENAISPDTATPVPSTAPNENAVGPVLDDLFDRLRNDASGD